MKSREKLCAWLFEVTKTPYAQLFKRSRTAWNLRSADLLKFPEGSLGHETGKFLKQNDFELIDKLEAHDVYHVICGFDTSVKNEVGMQFFLMGNGKRSFYLYSTIGICLFLLPEYFSYFMRCFKRGKKYHKLHELVLLDELHLALNTVRQKVKRTASPKLKLYNHINDFA